ncbi:MAG: hypothetical protein CTY24_13645, partial [Methylobacter sp.]
MKQKPPSAKQQAEIQQALLLHKNGQLAEATALYKKLLAALPGNPQLLAGLGLLHLQQGQYNQGLILFDKSL